MSTPIPERPTLLTEYLRMLAEGDDRNKATVPIARGLRAELDSVRAELDLSTSKAMSANAASRELAKVNREVARRAIGIARRARYAVYSMYARNDPRIGDYGLATPVKPRSKKSNGSEPPDSKAV